VGHLLQGRFKAILVDRDANLLEVSCYVELNPVRAAMVAGLADWPWSSNHGHIGLVKVPVWLGVRGLHGCLFGHGVQTVANTRHAARKCAQWVAAGRDGRLWDDSLNRQVFLGHSAFVERIEALMAPTSKIARAIPTRQRGSPKVLADSLRECATREEALWMAHTRSGLRMTALAAELGLSVARVSQLIAKAKASAALAEACRTLGKFGAGFSSV
jgi:putative transposase